MYRNQIRPHRAAPTSAVATQRVRRIATRNPGVAGRSAPSVATRASGTAPVVAPRRLVTAAQRPTASSTPWSPTRKFWVAFAVVTALGGCDGQGCAAPQRRCNGPREQDDRCAPITPRRNDDMPRGRFIQAPTQPSAPVAGAKQYLRALLETAEEAS